MEPNLEIILQSVEVLIFQLQVVMQSWILRQQLSDLESSDEEFEEL